MKKSAGVIAGIAALAMIPALAIVYLLIVFSALLLGGGTAAQCTPGGTGTTRPASSVDLEGVPEGPIAGYDHEQLTNAAHIIIAAQKLGIDNRGQVVGVMTAMGESSLINIDYGDWETSGIRNPDGTPTSSIGLFQQQDWWGTPQERMDPQTTATKFFTALLEIEFWETLLPTIAAHRVQGNANPYHYEKFFDGATEIVAALTGLPLTTTPGVGSCTVGPSGDYPPPNGNPPGPWGGHENGRIPVDLLTPIPWQSDKTLRGDATESLIQLDTAFQAHFGYHLPINAAYRDYAGQVEAKERYGNEAATPGTSNHGWALAVDIGDRGHWRISFSHEIYTWLQANAPAYGWVNPPWALPGGSGPDEAWHWEYWGVATA